MASSLFNIGLSGLMVSQRGLTTTGHNIANVNTDGFTRQTIAPVTRRPLGAGDGFIGDGVRNVTITRELDTFVTDALRLNTSNHSQVGEFLEFASQLDNILADPLGGLSPAVQGLFAGMHDLAADPSSVPARQLLLSEASNLVQRVNALDGRLAEVRAAVNGRIVDIVSEVNTFADGIAALNGEINRERSAFSGQPPNDLLDQRDELVRELSERIDVKTFFQTDGSLNVLVGSGQSLVVGTNASQLSTIANPFDASRLEIGFTLGVGATAQITNLIANGELAGAIQFREDVLDVAERSLGHVAVGIARTVNDQHALGQDLDGLPGGPFFNAVDQTAPRTFGHTANTGAPPAQITVGIRDVGALAQSDYLLERVGAGHQLTRLSDGTTFTFATFPAGGEVLDGLQFDLASGAIADGDQFLIQPTRFAARRLELSVASPRSVAAAAPVRGAAAINNTGRAVVSPPEVNHPYNDVRITFDTPPATFDVVDITTGATLLTDVAYTSGNPITVNGLTLNVTGAPAAGDAFDVVNTVARPAAGNGGSGTVGLVTVSPPDANLTDPVTITFTSASTFDVTGTTTGSPTTGVSYTSGGPISFNGWTVSISGAANPGDTFTIVPNTGGVGDNRNALRLAALQTEATLDGEKSTYDELYGQLVAAVGTQTRRAQIDQSARGALLDQLVAERAAISGVNLDEEAANLLRFQQSFQASAQLITVANDIFDSLLAAVGR